MPSFWPARRHCAACSCMPSVLSLVVPREVHVANVESEECKPQPHGHAIVADMVFIHVSKLSKTGAPCVVTNRSKLRAIRIFWLSSDGLRISHGETPRAIVRNVVGDHVVASTARQRGQPESAHAGSGSAEQCGYAVRPNRRQARARRRLLRALCVDVVGGRIRLEEIARSEGLVLLAGPRRVSLLRVMWWRRRESNPRPKTLHSRDYMLSHVIVLSPRRH
jgi:hypothetical protein